MNAWEGDCPAQNLSNTEHFIWPYIPESVFIPHMTEWLLSIGLSSNWCLQLCSESMLVQVHDVTQELEARINDFHTGRIRWKNIYTANEHKERQEDIKTNWNHKQRFTIKLWSWEISLWLEILGGKEKWSERERDVRVSLTQTVPCASEAAKTEEQWREPTEVNTSLTHKHTYTHYAELSVISIVYGKINP